jgi:U1 small nuclear ribonucleoprotein of 70kDa MW N terminal
MLSHHERTNMAISRSGLPKTVLELFDPREDLEYKPPIEHKKPALPLLGLGGYVGHFPGPDDPDYQPARNEVAQREERKFRSKECHLQVAVEEPSILERCGCQVQSLRTPTRRALLHGRSCCGKHAAILCTAQLAGALHAVHLWRAVHACNASSGPEA